MKKSQITVHQTFASVFLVIGAIAVFAVAFDYSGKIEVKLGAEGVHLQIN